jgi:hypothetical protein
MAHVCVGNRAEAVLMGYRDPILGRVESVTRGISVSNAAPSTHGLPSVDPVYTWVRLAQRVPVRVRITDVPPGVPLVSGMTVTVTIRDAGTRESGGWLHRRFANAANLVAKVVHGSKGSPDCVSRVGDETGTIATIPTAKPIAPLESRDPGLAPSFEKSPKIQF